MTASPRFYGFGFGLGYFVIYFLFALWPTGAGHGTYVFFLPLWPYLLGGVFYPAIGAIGADLRSALSKAAYVGLTLVHYLGIVGFYLLTDLANPIYVSKVWHQSDIAILMPTTVFAVGELIIWLNFIVQCAISIRSREVN